MAAVAKRRHGRLDSDYYESLRVAQPLNLGLVLLPGSKARVNGSDGASISITHSTVGVKLVWALRGCRPGVQHYRRATPHAVHKPKSLQCFFCNIDEAACAAHYEQKLPASERQLIDAMICACMSEHFCWQARLPWWPGPIDFLLLCHLVAIQADGSSHFKGIHERSRDQQLGIDIEFCVAAMRAGVSVIRVHDTQLKAGLQPGWLSHAVAFAKMCVCCAEQQLL